MRSVRLLMLLLPLAALAPVVSANAENEGLEDLDKATQLKVTADSLDDLNEVVDSLDTALEKGLDAENRDFAEQLLVASLVQRGSLLSDAVFRVLQQEPQRGMGALQFRQFALSDLQRAVALDPKIADAHMMIGRLLLLPPSDLNGAKRAFSEVADAGDLEPAQRAEALALRSELQRVAKRKFEDLNEAIKLQPESPSYLRLRAQHHLNEKQFDAALADVDAALKLDAENPPTNELRGMILLRLERFDDALASFNRASELTPQSSRPYQFRGELYRQMGDLDKAIEQLNKALELSPDNITVLLLRAEVYFAHDQADRALEDVDRAIAAQPQLLEPYRMRAEILAATGRMNEAITELTRLLPQVNGSARAILLNRLGAFHMIAGQPNKAIDVLNQAIELDPSDNSAHRLRADAYLNVGKHAEAIADFQRALTTTKDDEGLLNNLAWVLATSPDDKVRDGKRAVELATKACELTGFETPHILSTLAAAYAETGDFDNALKYSRQAVEVSQKQVDAATDDKEREQLKSDQKQLTKEVETYEQKKPVRERQEIEDTPISTPDNDRAAEPSVEPAPARTADF